MASNRSAFFLMRLLYLVSGLYPRRRDERELITGTCRHTPPHPQHTHTRMHAWTNGNTVDIPYTFNKHTPAPWPFAQSHHRAN